jgi:tetratricopeptide (TPR) repeat protein
MLAAAPRVETIRQRLARHYLNELQAASAAFGSGHDHSAYGLERFDREWPQIKHWQTWSAAQSEQDPDSASLCAHFPPAGAELLALRQTPQERIAWLTAGLRAARRIDDRRTEAECLFLMAWAVHKQAAIDEAEAMGREALALAEAIGDRVVTGRSLHLLGEIAVRRGEFAEAQQLHARALNLLRAAGDQAHLAEVYFSLSELAYLQGEFDSAREYAGQSHALLETLGLSPTTNNNLAWLGVTTAETGDLAGGERYARQSIELCRATGAQSTLAHGLYVLSGIARLKEDYPQALALVAESLQIAQAIDEEWLIPYLLFHRADLLGLLDDPRGAERDIDQALDMARRSGYRLALSTALIQRAEVQLVLGQAALARTALREGLAMAVSTRMALDQAHGVLVAARLWKQQGAAQTAAEWVGMLLSRSGVEQTVRRALAIFGRELEAGLGPDEYAAALARGRGLQWMEVVAEIVVALSEG